MSSMGQERRLGLSVFLQTWRRLGPHGGGRQRPAFLFRGARQQKPASQRRFSMRTTTTTTTLPVTRTAALQTTAAGCLPSMWDLGAGRARPLGDLPREARQHCHRYRLQLGSWPRSQPCRTALGMATAVAAHQRQPLRLLPHWTTAVGAQTSAATARCPWPGRLSPPQRAHPAAAAAEFEVALASPGALAGAPGAWSPAARSAPFRVGKCTTTEADSAGATKQVALKTATSPFAQQPSRTHCARRVQGGRSVRTPSIPPAQTRRSVREQHASSHVEAGLLAAATTQSSSRTWSTWYRTRQARVGGWRTGGG
eukprot:m.465269 g.465269  ORF g.465269 m.465269 type:complete len:311 (+) comp20360_c2_seq4:582-1514(+)